MKKLFILAMAALLTACGGGSNVPDDGNIDITDKFNGTWNIHENLQRNDDGTITYEAMTWGGMVANVKEHNLPADWTKYDCLVFEMAEPTNVPTQIMLSDRLKIQFGPGAMELKYKFGGQDVTSISEVALQVPDPTTLHVKRVYLKPSQGPLYSTTIWEGNCELGNWEKGFNVSPSKFTSAEEGDQLEIVYTTDTSNPTVSFWQLKTIYSGTEQPLEGNANELNDWGCATVNPGSTRYRITLTANDIAQLNEVGLYVNGYFNIVTQCNLLQ